MRQRGIAFRGHKEKKNITKRSNKTEIVKSYSFVFLNENPEDYYFSFARNYVGFDNDLEVILLDFF